MLQNSQGLCVRRLDLPDLSARRKAILKHEDLNFARVLVSPASREVLWGRKDAADVALFAAASQPDSGLMMLRSKLISVGEWWSSQKE